MKLISMKEFVLDEGRNPLQSDTQAWIRTCKYAEFLDTPLSLSMFVPTDENGDVLNEPPIRDEEDDGYFGLIDAVIDKKYREAKEMVLFERWTWKDTYAQHTNGLAIDEEICKENTMEELIMNGFELYLTPYAIKLLGL